MANNNLSIGQPFGITIWHGEYLRNHMANHPDLRLHQLQSHGFANHEAVLLCAFAAPPIAYVMTTETPSAFSLPSPASGLALNWSVCWSMTKAGKSRPSGL
jgi:hypothetical protein